MFDLMGAIRKKQQAPPPADSAETAESPQPRGSELADNLRKAADFSAGNNVSATIRRNPQPPSNLEAAAGAGYADLSANPQNPHPPAVRLTQNPDDLLAEIAAMLQADPDQLRALLSADDLDDIAHGRNSRGYMLDYFRQMRTDGKLPTITAAAPAPQGKPDTTGRAATWKPEHEQYLNHYTECTACYAPKGRYCEQGASLHQTYHDADHSAFSDINNP